MNTATAIVPTSVRRIPRWWRRLTVRIRFAHQLVNHWDKLRRLRRRRRCRRCRRPGAISRNGTRKMIKWKPIRWLVGRATRRRGTGDTMRCGIPLGASKANNTSTTAAVLCAVYTPYPTTGRGSAVRMWRTGGGGGWERHLLKVCTRAVRFSYVPLVLYHACNRAVTLYVLWYSTARTECTGCLTEIDIERDVSRVLIEIIEFCSFLFYKHP